MQVDVALQYDRTCEPYALWNDEFAAAFLDVYKRQSLYFVVNDAFYNKALPKVELPEGVIVDSLNKIAAENPEFIGKYYAKIAKTDEDGITALNTFLAQDGLLIYVPKNVKVRCV